MEVVPGVASRRIEALVLMGVVFVGKNLDEAGWRDRWAERRKAGDRTG